MSDDARFLGTELLPGETPESFVLRLERAGARETHCRKALRQVMGLPLIEAVTICRCLHDAKIREMEAKRQGYPNWPDWRHLRFAVQELGLPKDQARSIVEGQYEKNARTPKGVEGYAPC